MSQSNKPLRLRANATLACKNCRASHRRCEKPPKEDICTYCKNHRLHCTYTLGRKRGPKPRFPNFQSPLNIKFRETNTEEFQFSSLNFGTLHLYNDVITTSFRTNEVFIDQEPTANNQDTIPISPYKTAIEPSFGTTGAFISQGLMSNHNPNTTLISSYEIATKEFKFSSLNHPYDDAIITPFRTTEAFINQEPVPNNQNITPINLYETTNKEFQSSYLNFGTTHTYTIPSFGTNEAFIEQGLMLNNQNTTPINSYEIATEEFQNSNSLY
ncbi:14980_t:CDS:1 [Racocetra persica]|uniref:14980_t:CDS:1 n=1 Tax=Racocetra persica TaxID=160502 RepID=A0ACA9RQX1_9GLOM|nr:14980_t:CDS:1 [Racocetra persica]